MGAGLFLALDLAAGSYYARGSVLLFGWAAGVGLVRTIRKVDARERSLIVLALGIAWGTAISIGYNSPALAGGLLWLLVVRFDRAAIGRFVPWLAAANVLGMVFVRVVAPYRDRPAWQLTEELGDVLPGGRGIRTNPNVASALRELRELIERYSAGGAPVAVLTDYSVIWLDPKLRNPLPMEWPQATELGEAPELFARMNQALATIPPNVRIIVQRHAAGELAFERIEVRQMSHYYAVQIRVDQRGEKIEVTEFFEVYRPRTLP